MRRDEEKGRGKGREKVGCTAEWRVREFGEGRKGVMRMV